MSEDGIHVHGAHDHAVEHAAQHSSMGQQVALFSAVLATAGAIVSFFGGDAQNSAMLYKNNAVLERAEASDQWAFYQAKSIKQKMAETGAALAADPKVAEAYRVEAKRYAEEKKEPEAEAKKHEEQYRAWEARSEKALHPHHFLALSMTMLQIAIALASITVLTGKRWLLAVAGLAGLLGAALGVVAWI